MATPKDELEMSPLGGAVTPGRSHGRGLYLLVRRHRGQLDRVGHTTVWDGRFLDDRAAYNAFLRAIEADGMSQFLQSGETLH